MKNDEISVFPTQNNHFKMDEFEEALQDSSRRYSLRQLNFLEDISEEQIFEALQKSMKVCHLAGINSVLHFKKIYVYNPEISAIQIDWRLSKNGLNLMIMQTPSLNERMARWLWELADFK